MAEILTIAESGPAVENDDPVKALIKEVETLREQVQQLCAVVRQLVQLQSVANQKLDAALKGQPFFDIS